VPTIKEQIIKYPGIKADVRWIIVNGGINDVDVRRLLNPMVPQAALDAATKAACLADLGNLLALIGTTYPNATIFVVGYYPILSYSSDPFGIEALFTAIHAVEFQPLVNGQILKNVMIDHCLQFWKLSQRCIMGAVNQANANLGTRRCIYVDPGFAENNAVFAPQAFLWGVDPDPLTGFNATDEQAGPRVTQCTNANLAPLDYFTCLRASAGHPNVQGALAIATQLITSAGISSAKASAAAQRL
jgi:hypothetical protein